MRIILFLSFIFLVTNGERQDFQQQQQMSPMLQNNFQQQQMSPMLQNNFQQQQLSPMMQNNFPQQQQASRMMQSDFQQQQQFSPSMQNNFPQQQMSSSDFEQQQMLPSDFQRQQMSSSDFQQQQMSPSDFQQQQQFSSSMQNNFPQQQQMSSSDFEQQQMSPSDFQRQQMSSSDFQRQQMLSSDFQRQQMSSSDFQRQQQQFSPMMQNNFQPRFSDNGFQFQSSIQIPFPQCLSTDKAATILNPTTILNIFRIKLDEENRKLTQERLRNDELNNNDIMDFDAIQLRADTHNGALVARTATKIGQEIIAQLGCITNSSVTQQVDNFLRTIQLPADMCAYSANARCDGLTEYRTITGVCNNLQRVYEGSAQTALTRLLPAAYDDGLRLPRSQSVLGGPLPECRQISLAMGSKPVFDVSYNNLFVVYGQFVVHDIVMSTPVTDSGRTPITSCSCDSRDPELCMVVPVAANDPFMAGQKCMSAPATAQGFTEQICSLGIKDQLNGNSHYIDLSVTYGSTRATANGLRSFKDGLLKSVTKPWSKFELPPGQREGKSCLDSTPTNRCFAGGDSRLMENVLLSGIQAQWVRLHNIFARELARIRPDWKNNDHILYEEAKKILAGLHQRYIYDDWLPILIGQRAADKFFRDNTFFTKYDPSVPAVVFNDVVTGTLRLHTLVRDLFTRCKPNGQLIDQVWLNDIASKCKLAYDAANNGVDSLLCGSFYDYGFAGDANFAQTVHHQLFETTNHQGEIRRNDIVSINICRGREHGISGYNNYRQLCGLRRATQFQDFADTMPLEHVQRLQMIYKHPDDVDLFVGVNHENHVDGGIVGTVSSCLIGMQFRNLKYGDRFFYKHEGQFTPDQLNSINKYSYTCFLCHSTDVEKIPANPFRPPNDQTNPLVLCSQCPIFDFNPWRLNTGASQ